MYLPYQDFMES